MPNISNSAPQTKVSVCHRQSENSWRDAVDISSDVTPGSGAWWVKLSLLLRQWHCSSLMPTSEVTTAVLPPGTSQQKKALTANRASCFVTRTTLCRLTTNTPIGPFQLERNGLGGHCLPRANRPISAPRKGCGTRTASLGCLVVPLYLFI